MKVAVKKSNKPDESRAAANSISQQKIEKKRALGFADNQPGPAAGRLKSVPNGPAGSSIQRKWVPHDDKESSIKLMRWDNPIDGKTWFSVEGEDLLFYRDAHTESERKPYLQWLKEGWLGLTDSALARDAGRDVRGGVDPRAETEEESFVKMVNQGQALYASMGPTERLNELSPAWKMYQSDPVDPEGGRDPVYKDWGIKVCVKTGFNDTYMNRLRRDSGHYQNYFYFPSGTVVASANYRAGPEEKEPLSNSEVIYHQLLEAAAAAREAPQMKTLIRDHVVNKTLQPIIRRVRNERGKGDLTFEPGDPIFFVLLTTPNVKTGVFLVNDRGHLIGIKTITKLVLLGKGSVEIHFG